MVLASASSAEPRFWTYALLEDDQVLVFNPNGEPNLGRVPEEARAAIEQRYPGRLLSFPEDGLNLAARQASPADGSEDPADAQDPDLLWLDPKLIQLVYRGDAQTFLGSEPPADDDWDTPHELRFDQLDVFRALEDRLLLGKEWEDSDFYRRVTQRISRGEPKWGCHTEEQFRERLAGLEALYGRILVEGYRPQGDIEGGRPKDEIRVAIRRDGRFLFLDGRHRLSIAKLIGLPAVPVRVVARHPQWLSFRDRVESYAAKRGGKLYQTVDHPDLEHYPAYHGSERIEMIRAALQDFETSGKRLLDVGTHWGYMAQQMARLGFEVTAVESNKTCARFAEEIRDATESRFDVWRGSIFDFPDVERQDVILALSIFHHFIKTPELHEELTTLLRRITAEVMIFEPHRHDPPAQMKGAYRNYPAREFAELVAGEAGFTAIEMLGEAPDGRSLFKLSR